MKRIVISLLAGIGLVFGALTVGALALFQGDTNGILPFLLYWPWLVTDTLGFGTCIGADGLSAEKFACVRMALFLDAILYPLLISVSSYIIHGILFQRPERLRRSSAV